MTDTYAAPAKRMDQRALARGRLLERLGLSTLAGVKAFRGELIKAKKGRDIHRIRTTDADGHERVLYLKRSWKPYKKDGLASLLRRGRVWSVSRREWENSKKLEAAGLRTAVRVAHGEECGLLWEKFSFILTEAALGAQSVEEFLRTCVDPTRRRRVFDALAGEIRRMHEAGLASPDLFTRHLFVDESAGMPRFCFIDMARLNCRWSVSDRMRARDLAALNLTAPLRFVSARERIRFLRVYSRRTVRRFFPLIRRRVERLLGRKKFSGFATGIQRQRADRESARTKSRLRAQGGPRRVLPSNFNMQQPRANDS